MIVVGGTYREWVRDPEVRDLLGSGLRAAAALSAMGSDVTLHTAAAKLVVDDVRTYADTYGFHIETVDIPHSYRFAYDHPLARPRIEPPLRPSARDLTTPLIQASGDAVLMFGMLEARARVSGRRVVYDPQNHFAPVAFEDTGSKAEHLAIVANYREASQLTRERDPAKMCERLIDRGCEVAVIKMGPRGALLGTEDSVATIPAYRTESVWPLGSGDIFSAVFARLWAEENRTPLDAANEAAAATAFYCATRQLQIPASSADRLALVTPRPVPVRPRGDASERILYLAGPFFSFSQRWLVTEARDVLNGLGVGVFSPYHDVGIGAAADVIPRDLAAIPNCAAMLAFVESIDAGTLFEVGFARSLGLPVIALVGDVSDNQESLKILLGSGVRVTRDFASAIYHAAWACSTVDVTEP